MLLFEYDLLPWLDAMSIFHALGRLGVNAVSIVSPDKPFISVGYFQDARLEVDFEFCKQAGLPVMRREIGGGATYLDYNQIFYHVILRRDHPLATLDISRLYQVLSQPVIETYREFGIETRFKEVNDIITKEGRKISGEGAANIGNSVVFVGSLLLDFNYEAMVHALKVPDEKFRDKIYKTMEENLTTMKRELGELPPREEIRKVLIEKFEKLLGPFERVSIDTELKKKMDEVGKILVSPDFVFKRTPRKPEGVRIRHGVEVLYTAHKAKGGLIRTYQEVQERRRLADIAVTGDFTLFPKENLDVLDRHLIGSEKVRREIESRIEEFYEKTKSQTPGVTIEDWVQAIKVIEE